MTRNPIVFNNGTLVSSAKVEVDGVIYDVDPAQYEGTTPLSANNLNQLQTNIYDSIEEVDNKNNYSETEQVVGKWIDNKPLYRKVLQINNPSNFDTTYDINISSLNADWLEIENFQFEYTYNNIKYSFPNNGYSTSNDFIRIFRRDNTIRIISGSTQTGSTNKKLTFILKYTKTTD